MSSVYEVFGDSILQLDLRSGVNVPCEPASTSDEPILAPANRLKHEGKIARSPVNGFHVFPSDISRSFPA